METGTVKDELLKFFSYDKSTASNSAFFQQRPSFQMMLSPICSMRLTAFIPTLYTRTNISFLHRMVLLLPLPEIFWIRMPILLPMARPLTVITKFM